MVRGSPKVRFPNGGLVLSLMCAPLGCRGEGRKTLWEPRGFPYKSDRAACQKFEPFFYFPQRCHNLVLLTCLGLFFTSKSYQFWITQQVLGFPSYFFLAFIPLVGVILVVVILDFNTLSGTKPQYLSDTDTVSISVTFLWMFLGVRETVCDGFTPKGPH